MPWCFQSLLALQINNLSLEGGGNVPAEPVLCSLQMRFSVPVFSALPGAVFGVLPLDAQGCRAAVGVWCCSCSGTGDAELIPLPRNCLAQGQGPSLPCGPSEHPLGRFGVTHWTFPCPTPCSEALLPFSLSWGAVPSPPLDHRLAVFASQASNKSLPELLWPRCDLHFQS